MKILFLTRKALVEFSRDRQLAAVYLFFPALMVLMYFYAFGQTTSMASYLTLLVDNRDTGPHGAQLLADLRAARFDGQPVFTIIEDLPSQAGLTFLEEGKAALKMVVPADFSTRIENPGGQAALIELYGDPLSDTYVFSRSFLSELLRTFGDRRSGWNQPLPVQYEFLPNTGKTSDFQFGVPGILCFGILFGVITSALVLVRENTSGALKRLRMSGVSGFQVLSGAALANLVMAMIQAPLTFVVAIACGFETPGSLWLAVGIAVLLSLAGTGFGFLTACFSESEGAATAIGTAVMTPLVFFSGALFPMPQAVLFRAGETAVQVYDLLPSTHGAEALRRVLVYGDQPADVMVHLVLLAGLSLGLLVLGAVFYQRRVLDRVS